MEPTAILGLAGTAVALVKTIYTTSAGLNEMIQAVRTADKSLVRLHSQIELFALTIEEISKWLGEQPELSSKLKLVIDKALKSCQIVVSDIEGCVTASKPSPKQSEVRFRDKLKLVWNDKAIKEHERMMSTQFQAFTLIVAMKSMAVNQPTTVDQLIESPSNQQLFCRGQEDASSIVASRDGISHLSTYDSDDGRGLDHSLSIDEDIARSGPYEAQLRKLMFQQFQLSSSPAEAPSSPSNERRLSTDHSTSTWSETQTSLLSQNTTNTGSSSVLGKQRGTPSKHAQLSKKELKLLGDDFGRLPLHVAASEGMVHAMSECLTVKGTEFISQKDYKGKTALFYSCINHTRNSKRDPRAEALKLLLDKGADVQDDTYLHHLITGSTFWPTTMTPLPPREGQVPAREALTCITEHELDSTTVLAFRALCDAGADPNAVSIHFQFWDQKWQNLRMTPLGLLCSVFHHNHHALSGFCQLFKEVRALTSPSGVDNLWPNRESESPTFVLTWSFVGHLDWCGEKPHLFTMLSAFSECIFHLKPSGKVIMSVLVLIDTKLGGVHGPRWAFLRGSKRNKALSNRAERWRMAKEILTQAYRRALGWEDKYLKLHDFVQQCSDSLCEKGIIDYQIPPGFTRHHISEQPTLDVLEDHNSTSDDNAHSFPARAPIGPPKRSDSSWSSPGNTVDEASTENLQRILGSNSTHSDARAADAVLLSYSTSSNLVPAAPETTTEPSPLEALTSLSQPKRSKNPPSLQGHSINEELTQISQTEPKNETEHSCSRTASAAPSSYPAIPTRVPTHQRNVRTSIMAFHGYR